MVFGARTDTGDADGKIVKESQIAIAKNDIERVLAKFRGEIEQVPPMYSAVKVGGQRLYKLARRGEVVERQPRKINIYQLKLNGELAETSAGPAIAFSVSCSKGTYVRQLVVDIGDDLGCGAYLASLRRTYAEPFHISQALEMETIVTLAKIGKLATVLISPSDLLRSGEVAVNG